MALIAIDTIIPEAADQADGAAFRSLEAALRFAFGNSHRGEPDSLAKLQKGAASGHPVFEDEEERAAWAGAIRRRVSALHPDHVAILVLRFAPRAFPCACRRPCCSGLRRNEEWANAAGEVVRASAQAVPGTVSHRQLREGVVRRWAGAERTNIGILADRCGVHRNTASKQARLVKVWLEQTLRAALATADAALRIP